MKKSHDAERKEKCRSEEAEEVAVRKRERAGRKEKKRSETWFSVCILKFSKIMELCFLTMNAGMCIHKEKDNHKALFFMIVLENND